MYTTLGMLKGTGGGGGGAYPIIASDTFSAEISAPINIDMPPVVNAGDLLIMLIRCTAGPGDPSGVPTGWTNLLGTTPYTGFYKWAAGTEDGTEVTVTVSGDPDLTLAVVLRITGADSGQNPQGIAGALSTSSTTANPPALDPSWADANNLFITAVLGDMAATSLTVTYPSGYSLNNQYYKTPANGVIAVAAKRSTNSASEDPGNFSFSATLQNYNTATIAVKGT